MLITLLSPFLGIIGSLLPSVVRIFERKQELKFQSETMKMQLELARQNAQIQIAVEDAKADAADAESVRSYDNNVDGGNFINALRASLRPVITYTFFIVFMAIKLTVLFVMIDQGASMEAMLKAIWDQDTMALFGTVMGFWFGSRILEKTGYGGMTPRQNITSITTTTSKRTEEHTSELQSRFGISYAVFCLKKKTTKNYLCDVQPQSMSTIMLA